LHDSVDDNRRIEAYPRLRFLLGNFNLSIAAHAQQKPRSENTHIYSSIDLQLGKTTLPVKTRHAIHTRKAAIDISGNVMNPMKNAAKNSIV